MKSFIILLSVMIFSLYVYAGQGKLILHNGHVIQGEIQKTANGDCWVNFKNGRVKFASGEIKKIVMLYGSKNAVKTELKKIKSVIFPRQRSFVGGNSSKKYDDIINREANRHNIDPALVKAVIKAESNFNENDRSSKGACGLMQLMPNTAKILGVKSIFSPEENIKAGTSYLKDMLYLFEGNVNNALAAYNAGPTTVRKYKGIPPYRETREYVKKVNSYYSDYSKTSGISSYTDDSGCIKLYNVR